MIIFVSSKIKSLLLGYFSLTVGVSAQIKRERALQDAKRNDKARKIKEENRIRKGIIMAVKNIRRPDQEEDRKHLDLASSSIEHSREVMHNPEEATKRTSVSREGTGERQPGAPDRGRTEDGGFFVTQQAGED